MIGKAPAYTSSDGGFHPTLAEAQKAEIKIIMIEALQPEAGSDCALHCATFAAVVVDCQTRILDILTTKPSSRPRQRKVNGFVARKRSTKPAKPTTPSAEASTASA